MNLNVMILLMMRLMNVSSIRSMGTPSLPIVKRTTPNLN